jgi:hypothetical protein
MINGMKNFITLSELIFILTQEKDNDNLMIEIDYHKDCEYEIIIKQKTVNNEKNNMIIKQYGFFNNKQYLRDAINHELKNISSSFERHHHHIQNIVLNPSIPSINPHFIMGYMQNTFQERIRSKIYSIIDPKFNFMKGTIESNIVRDHSKKINKLKMDDIVDPLFNDDFALLFDNENRITYKEMVKNKKNLINNIKSINGEINHD